MPSLPNLLKPLNRLAGIWKQVTKPFAALKALPPIFRIAALAIGVISVALVIWSKTESLTDVALFLGIVAVVVGGLWLVDRVIRGRQRKMSDGFVGDLGGTEMIEELREQWLRAVKELDSTGVDRYNMAFYMLIGEPQSGKTTTLQKSGLNFPIGMDKIQGIGGTRNLDWWFTDEAVILDTAGRLTFQDEEQTDEQEWREFLKLLQRYRPKCPINGVIITIPCTSLLQDDSEARERKATVLRKALIEIQRSLEIQFPVYVLVTKADRIGGFAEFFGQFRAMEQTQLLGWSRPKGQFDQPFSGDETRGAFRDLVGRLRRWRVFLLDHFGEEMTPEERDGMYAFPEEFALLEQPLTAYLESVFPDSRLLDPLFFRGFFVTSGIQRGVPVLEACARILGGSALGEQILGRASLNAEKAYFIRDFYRKKVFQERGLIRPTKSRVQRVVLVKRVGYTVAAAAALLGTATIGWRFKRITDDVAIPRQQFSELKTALQASDSNRVGAVLVAIDAMAPRGPIRDEPAARAGSGSVESDTRGTLRDVLEGDRLSGGRFFSIAGLVDEEDLKRDLVRAVRRAFNDGVISGLRGIALDNLEKLAGFDGQSARPARAVRIERRLGVLEEVLAMLVESRRAEAESEAVRSDSGAAVVAPPNELDSFFDLTLGGESKAVQSLDTDRSQLQMAKRAFELLRRVAAGEGKPTELDERLRTPDLRGLGLTSAWTGQSVGSWAQVLDQVRAEVQQALVEVAPGREWLEQDLPWPPLGPEEVDSDERWQAYTSEFRAKLASGAWDAPKQERAVGYLLLRAAKLEGRIIETFAQLEEAERRLAGSSSASLLTLPEDDAWFALHTKVVIDLRELRAIQEILVSCNTSLEVAVAALVQPINARFEVLRSIAQAGDGRVVRNWDALFARFPADAPDSARTPWIVLGDAPGSEPWIEWAEKALASSKDKMKLDLVFWSDPTLDQPGALEVAIGTQEARTVEVLDEAAKHTRAILDRLRSGGETPWLMGKSGADVELVKQKWQAAPEGSLPLQALQREYGTEYDLVAPSNGKSNTALGGAIAASRALRQRVALVGFTRELERLGEILLAFSFEELRPPRTAREVASGRPDAAYEHTVLGASVAFAERLTNDITAVEDQNDPELRKAKQDALDVLDVRLSIYLAAWVGHWTTTHCDELRRAYAGVSEADNLKSAREAARRLVGGANDRTWGPALVALRDDTFKQILGEASGDTRSGWVVNREHLPQSAEQFATIQDALAALESRRADTSFGGMCDALSRLVWQADYSSTQDGWRERVQRPEWLEAVQGPLDYFAGIDAGRSKVLRAQSALPTLDVVDQVTGDLALELRGHLVAEIEQQIKRDYESIRDSLLRAGLLVTDSNVASAMRPSVGNFIDADGVFRLFGESGDVPRFCAAYGKIGVFVYAPPDLEGAPKELGPSSFLGVTPLSADRNRNMSRALDLVSYQAWVSKAGAEVAEPEFSVSLLPGKERDQFRQRIKRLTVATALAQLGKGDGPYVKHFFCDVSESQSTSLKIRREPRDFIICVSGSLPGGAFKIDERFEFVRFTGASGMSAGAPTPAGVAAPIDAAGPFNQLRYSGPDGILEFLLEMNRVTEQSSLVFLYDAPSGGVAQHSTTIQVVIGMKLDEGDESTSKRQTGSVELKLRFNGVTIPRLPLTMEPWN